MAAKSKRCRGSETSVTTRDDPELKFIASTWCLAKALRGGAIAPPRLQRRGWLGHNARMRSSARVGSSMRKVEPLPRENARLFEEVRARTRELQESLERQTAMAITAWSAKVLSRSICRWVNGLTSLCRIKIAPIASALRMSGTTNIVRWPSRRAISLPSGYSSVSACRSVT